MTFHATCRLCIYELYMYSYLSIKIWLYLNSQKLWNTLNIAFTFYLSARFLSPYVEEWRLPVKIKCCKNEIYSVYCGKVLGFPTDAAAGVHCLQVLILFSQKNKIVYGIFQWRHLEFFTCLVFTIFTSLFIGLHRKLALFVL